MSNPISFKVTLLGTGTSQGVPVIGCTCDTCLSLDEKDKRLRASVLIEFEDFKIAIDAGPDFRQQMLRAKVNRLDAILLTHEHNDHVIGLDDVRPFNFRQAMDMPIWALPRVLSELRERFSYAFSPTKYPGSPGFDIQTIDIQKSIHINGIEIVPIEIMHGTLPIVGFRIGDFTYLTDLKKISDSAFEKIKGTRILVTNALHHDPHVAHMNLNEALDFVERVGAEQTYLTHVSHLMGKAEDTNPTLPKGVQLAFDEQEIFV